MKILIIVCCLFLSMNAFAQSDTLAKKADTSKNVATPLYIIDGEIRKGTLYEKDINPQNIVEIQVLKDAETTKKYGEQAANGVIIIITRPYAIAAYEKKIGTLSSKYKEYIDKKHDDTNLAYVIDNTIKDQQKISTIEDLYQLSVSNIVKIQFKKDSHFSTDATVIITTKDN